MVGRRTQNIETIESIYRCCICSLLLRDPVQLVECGHRFCQSCLNEQQGEIIICPQCDTRVLRDKLKLDRGFINDMQTIIITCGYCDWTDKLKNYQNHLNEKHSNTSCNFCKEKFTSINDLEQHQLLSCDKRQVDCPLKYIGCNEKVPNKNLSEHYQSDQHQRVIMNFVLQLQKKTSHQTTYFDIKQFEGINEAIKNLLMGIATLTNDSKRLHIEYVQCQTTLQTVLEQLPLVRKSIDEHYNFVDAIKPYQESLYKELISVKEQFYDIKSATYDGNYIWKINNVQETIVAAQSGQQISIDSQPFYTSPNGYKMCLRLYFNKDSTTHASLAFILMRGEYDAILKFPFCFKVIVYLYDQMIEQQHIIHKFRPDVTSENCRRPRNDINIAHTISNFVPSTIFSEENNRYIKDDTIFIKMIIDFMNMSDDILPYAINLSPVFTTQVQQKMIQEQIEERQPQTMR